MSKKTWVVIVACAIVAVVAVVYITRKRTNRKVVRFTDPLVSETTTTHDPTTTTTTTTTTHKNMDDIINDEYVKGTVGVLTDESMRDMTTFALVSPSEVHDQTVSVAVTNDLQMAVRTYKGVPIVILPNKTSDMVTEVPNYELFDMTCTDAQKRNVQCVIAKKVSVQSKNDEFLDSSENVEPSAFEHEKTGDDFTISLPNTQEIN
jgi:hypothetical protein